MEPKEKAELLKPSDADLMRAFTIVYATGAEALRTLLGLSSTLEAAEIATLLFDAQCNRTARGMNVEGAYAKTRHWVGKAGSTVCPGLIDKAQEIIEEGGGDE